jgi:hypothetical protein
MEMHWRIEWLGVTLDIMAVTQQKKCGTASWRTVQSTVSVGLPVRQYRPKVARIALPVLDWLYRNHPSILHEFRPPKWCKYRPWLGYRRLWRIAKVEQLDRRLDLYL